MKKDSGLYKKIKIYCYIVGLIAFLTAFFISVFLLHNLEKNEKTIFAQAGSGYWRIDDGCHAAGIFNGVGG